MKNSPKKPEDFSIRTSIPFFIVFFSLALNTIAPGLVFSSENTSDLNGTIEVSPETVAPAWQIIWEKARHMGRSRDVDGAIALYRNLLEQRPGLSEARFELAVLLLHAGKKQPAMIELEKVLEVRPGHLRALLALAGLMDGEGRYKRAVDLYERAAKLLVRQSQALGAGNKGAGPDEAAESEDLFNAETGLYHSLKGLHRDSDALVHLKKALRLRPGDRSLEFKLASDLMEQGRIREALPHLRRLAPALKGNPSFTRKYVRALDACFLVSDIRKVLEPVILPLRRPGEPCPKGWTPDDIEWGIQKLYSIYLLDDDAESAVELLQGIKDSHAEWISPRLLRSLGRIYFGQRRYIASINTFTSLVVRCPKDEEAHLFLARAFQKLQMINKAADSYMTVYSLTRDTTCAARALRLLVLAGRFSRAKSLIAEHFSGKYGSTGLPDSLLIRICIGSGDLKETLRLIDRQPHLLENARTARDFLGLVVPLSSGRSGSPEITRDMFLSLRALEACSQANRPWIMAAIGALSDSGEHEAVNRILLDVWERNHPLWAAARLSRCRVFSEAPGKGLEVLSRSKIKAQRLDILRSDLMRKAGQGEQALQSLTRLPASCRWIDEMRSLRLAEIYLQRKNYRQAMQYYRKLLSLYPDHLKAHDGRFRLYASCGLWVQANWEALGIFIIRGSFPELKEADMPADSGSVMNGSFKGMPDPGKILSGHLCKGGGQACQLFLARSYEGHGDVREAVSAWRAFLKRNPDYWPGYGSLAGLLSSLGDEDGAQDLEKMACSLARNSAGDGAFIWPPGPPWSNENPGCFWDALRGRAMAVWQDIYCAH